MKFKRDLVIKTIILNRVMFDDNSLKRKYGDTMGFDTICDIFGLSSYHIEWCEDLFDFDCGSCPFNQPKPNVYHTCTYLYLADSYYNRLFDS